MVSKIANHHNHAEKFFIKIEKILKYFKKQITSHFSSFEIFNIFKKNKRITLFLINEKKIILDKYIFNTMINRKYHDRNYFQYFLPEINDFLTDNDIIIEKILNEEEIKFLSIDLDDKFYQNRKISENECYICQLIRGDNIDEFISYVNKNDILLSSVIGQSIYETSLLILKNQSTLIEYAAFFGSIQIFKYLFKNDAQRKPSIWIYAIHGNNPELIHFLEDEKIEPENNSYKKCC